MALKKLVTTNFGVSVEYWKICNISEDYITKQIKIMLGGYISEEARLSGAAALTSLVETLGYCQYTDENGQIVETNSYVADMDRETMYEALKETENWKDAEDC